MSKEKTVYIFGHKNPDTDCGVAAAAYARLKQLQGHKNYIAARAGRFAPQTEYVFKKFNVPYPEYIPDLIPKVQYYMSDKCETVSQHIRAKPFDDYESRTQNGNFNERQPCYAHAQRAAYYRARRRRNI